MPRLENWAICIDPVDGYAAPEQMPKPFFTGEVYGHPNQSRHPDGKWVGTSPIVSYDSTTNEFLTTSGSKYTLGQVSEEYDKLYPDAKKKLVEAMSK